MTHVPKDLALPGWLWSPRGLTICSLGKRVFFPIRDIARVFAEHLEAEGVPAWASVGACMSVGALFSAVAPESRADRRERRAKAGKRERCRDLPSKTERQKCLKAMRGRRRERIKKGLKKAVTAVAKAAKAVVTNPVFRAGFAAVATALPVLAPAAVALEAGARVAKKVEQGAKAARAIKRGVKTAKNISAVKRGIQAKRAIDVAHASALDGNTVAQRALGGAAAGKVILMAAARRKAA